VVLRGVALGDRERLRESDDHNREGAGEQSYEVLRRDARERDEVKAGRHVSDDRHAVVLQVERPDREDRKHDHDDHAGELRQESGEREQRDQPREPDGDRGPFPAPDVGDRVREHRERVARRLLDSHHLGQLADRDVEAEADDEALQHRAREEAGDEAHPGEAARDVDHANHERQRAGQGDVLARARARRSDNSH
jgi:hypothetical protein